jgi:uncharacterized protein (TIGR02145 family)
MKKKYALNLFFTTVLVLISIKTYSFDYAITFKGIGASTVIDSVLIRNITKSSTMTLRGDSVLHLTNIAASIDRQNATVELISIYPNPIQDKSTLSLNVKNDGYTQINAYALDGRKVVELSANLLQGKNSFQLILPKGVYIIQVNGNGFSYNTKAISHSANNVEPKISLISYKKETKPQKVISSTNTIDFNVGDQLIYIGISGKNRTIVADKPEGSKTANFNFVECKDADGNDYAVVVIGNQIWMAENLNTTKYRNGNLIGTTNPSNLDIYLEESPKYQWTYNGEETNAAIYGRLYTLDAATDSNNIAPMGWHVSTSDEWETLENYLIINGYNYDGTTTDNKIAKSLATSTLWSTDTGTGAIGNDLTKNNASGFSAVPGGYRTRSGFSGIVKASGWWSVGSYWGLRLISNDHGLFNYSGIRNAGFSVRCVKDSN